jgi:hypothetical protein
MPPPAPACQIFEIVNFALGSAIAQVMVVETGSAKGLLLTGSPGGYSKLIRSFSIT